MAGKVLVVDDEKMIVKGIKFSLIQDYSVVDCAYDGEEALDMAKNNDYDIILLDIMLPKMNGLEVCQQIREFSNVPIIMLTAKGDDMDKIMGLEYGADDYITKPFNILEVKARMKAILRRNNKPEKEQAKSNVLNIGDMRIDCDSRSLFIRGKEIYLTAKEFDLLELLAFNPNRVYSRDVLLKTVWGADYPGDGRTVDVHIRRLREKIEDNSSEPKYVHTKWVIILMFNINKGTRGQSAKSRMNHKKLITDILSFFLSTRFRLVFIIAVMSIISTISAVKAVKYSYTTSLVEARKAYVNNEAVLIAAEFTKYGSIDEAHNDGVYENLMNYSSLNAIRIRLVDKKYNISVDTYAVDTGKTMINSKVITVYDSPKTITDYSKKTGNIEAASPVYNSEGQLIAVLVVNLDISDISQIAGNAFDRIWVIEFVIITIILVVSIIVTYFYFKPYKKALHIVEEVDFGYIDKRMDVKGSTELRQFAKHFNSIMDKNSELDNSRSEFVSNVSHELKTPITSIKVLADSLNTQEDVPVEVYKEFMVDIVSEIDRENKIIEDLLCMVRLDKASATLNISSVNLNELLELVLKRLKPLAQKKNIELLFESFRPVVAQIDEVKITQVISNLVENAIKYNDMDGWVHVSLNADHQFFFVRVEDSGIGIPKESQSRVFERFYRVDKARSRQTGGTGLGLSIVKNIILMHHGTIKLYSEEGMGTTFTFRIPLNYVESDDEDKNEN